MGKGNVAGEKPIAIDVKEGEAYFWCSCGRSANQPFCDGSHKGSGFSPLKWQAEEDGKRYFCTCKQTDGQPFCDGSHKALEETAAKPAADSTVIEQRENGPLVVKNLQALTDANGDAIEAKPVMALCRCGKSENKPFCDGSHNDAGFSSANETDDTKGRVHTYAGREVTVYYNKLLCSHAAECGRLNAAVFDTGQKPWIQPDKGSVESIREAVVACPSGALTMSEPGGDAQHGLGDNVVIKIERHGPYRVANVKIDGVKRAEQASENKYVLCRCGLSANKPFCDGNHVEQKWHDGS